jgi:hypothetical protein
MRLRSGGATTQRAAAVVKDAAAAAAVQDDAAAVVQDQNAALPHDVLVRIFSHLPRGVLAVTPGPVCRSWAAAAANAKAALAPPSREERKYPYVPSWYVRDMIEHWGTWRKEVMLDAALFHGQVDLLPHFYSRWLSYMPPGFLGASACRAAAEGGSIAALQWLRMVGCRWYEDACIAAAFGGHWHVIAYLLQNGVPWDVLAFDTAAEAGQLHVLQVARLCGFEWSKGTCNAAAAGNRLEVLQWCVAQGAPINVKTCLRCAQESPECQAWLRATFPGREDEDEQDDDEEQPEQEGDFFWEHVAGLIWGDDDFEDEDEDEGGYEVDDGFQGDEDGYYDDDDFEDDDDE